MSWDRSKLSLFVLRLRSCRTEARSLMFHPGNYCVNFIQVFHIILKVFFGLFTHLILLVLDVVIDLWAFRNNFNPRLKLSRRLHEITLWRRHYLLALKTRMDHSLMHSLERLIIIRIILKRHLSLVLQFFNLSFLSSI